MNIENKNSNNFYHWISSDSDNENNINDDNISDKNKKEIIIQRIMLNILSMDIHKVKYLINKYNINVNNPFFDYVYNKNKGQIIYNRTLLVWCLLLYQDYLCMNNFNHKKLYDFIYFLIKEKIVLDDTNSQIQDAIEIINDCIIDIEFHYHNNIKEEKKIMMIEHLKKLDTKLTFLWAHICNVNERSTVYNYT